MLSKITEYTDYCLICGKPAEIHHIFKGVKHRTLCTEDGLVIPLCREHHQGNMSVHSKREMNVLCEMLGQAIYERNYLISQMALPFESEDEAFDRLSRECREAFRRRYQKSYL